MYKTLIDRPIATTMIILIIVVFGIVGLQMIPVSLVPSADIPYISIQATAPKMSAREINERIVKVLHQELSQIEGIDNIVAESKDGIGQIKLSFIHGSDMSYMLLDVNEKIDKCIPYLPEIDRPKVLKANDTDIPAFYINITHANKSDINFSQISRLTTDVLSKRLEQLQEVSMVDISGYQHNHITINPDPSKLEQIGITLEEFESIIKSYNIDFGNVSIQDGQYLYNIKFLSKITSIEDISNIWLDVNGRILQIKDIATIKEVPTIKSGSIRSDGKQCITMAVYKQSDAKMSDLRTNINILINDVEKEYPQIKLTLTRDQTKLLEYSINNLYQNIIVGLILACSVIFIFIRNLKSSLLVLITMPVSILLSLSIFWITGLSINIISLSGVLLGIGMMSDNTVILIDNISGRLHRGDTLRNACIIGTQEVATPMLSSILTTCAVFIPMVFAKGLVGELFFDQAAAISIILFSSFLVIIVVIPVYFYYWSNKNKNSNKSIVEKETTADIFMKKWEERIMGWFIDHRSISFWILCFSIIGSTLLFIYMDVEKFPEITRTESILTIDWNEQITLSENESRVKNIETILIENCNQITSYVGVQDFILEHTENLQTNETSIYMNCENEKLLKNCHYQIQSFLNHNYPQATFSIKQSGNIFDAIFIDDETPIVASILPYSKPTIEIAEIRNVLDSLRKILPEIKIENPKTKRDALLIASSEKMALYGVSYEEITANLKNILNGNKLLSIASGSYSIPVYIGRDVSSLYEIISNNYIYKEDMKIPLSEFLNMTYIDDFRTINHGDNGDYYPIYFQVESEQVPRVISAIREYSQIQKDYDITLDGSWFTNRKIVQQIILLLMVAIVLLYLILAIQFDSLLQPLIILSEIIIDIFAALITLSLMGISLNIMSVTGLIIVSGIVINDSILKVDTINKLRMEGYKLREAITIGCTRRMKAIIMTSLTTILSVTPFLSRGSIGDDLQYPMSIVIIVGMSVGTIISLFILPSLYYSLYYRQNK